MSRIGKQPIAIPAGDIVSGDKDLLVIEQFGNVQIVTAKDFYEKYLLS